MSEETFTDKDIEHAIEQWLEYGERSYISEGGSSPRSGGHKGYYSGGGWAARCLRYHLKRLKERKETT